MVRGLVRRRIGAGCAILLMLPALPQAAAAASITFYANVDFTGPSVTYGDAVADIDAGMALLSARSTGRWQICPRNDFRGACIEVDGGVANLKREFGFFAKASSARPVTTAAAAPAAAHPTESTAPPPAPGAAAPSAATRPTAVLYPRPAAAGLPIAACGRGAAPCGVQAATAFCRAEGFDGLGYSTTATDGGEAIVTDVLCIRAPAS